MARKKKVTAKKEPVEPEDGTEKCKDWPEGLHLVEAIEDLAGGLSEEALVPVNGTLARLFEEVDRVLKKRDIEIKDLEAVNIGLGDILPLSNDSFSEPEEAIGEMHKLTQLTYELIEHLDGGNHVPDLVQLRDTLRKLGYSVSLTGVSS